MCLRLSAAGAAPGLDTNTNSRSYLSPPLPSAKSGHVWSSLVLLKGPCRSTHGAKARCTSLTVVAKLLRCKLDTRSTGA